MRGLILFIADLTLFSA